VDPIEEHFSLSQLDQVANQRQLLQVSYKPISPFRSATGRAIVASAAVLTLVVVICSSVLGIEFSPFRIVSRIVILGDAGGSWGVPWEPLARPPSAYQQDALASIIHTTTQLGLASVLVCSLSLVLHTVSRMLAMWRPLAIRCALGATLRHLTALVARELGALVIAGAVIGTFAGGLSLAGLWAFWPVLFSKPSPGPAFLAAVLAAVVSAAIVAFVALLLLVILQRGVRSVAQLHGTHITTSGPLLFVQHCLAALQVAALLVVTYGCTLILRASAASMAEGRLALSDSSVIGSMDWAASVRGPFERADRIRAVAPSMMRPYARITLSSPDAWIGMGKELRVLAPCGDCRIGPYYRPLNAATVRMIAVAPGSFRSRHLTQAGRDFTAADTMGGQRVAVLNNAAWQAMYPGSQTMDHLFQVGVNDVAYTVIGVVHYEAPPVLGNSGPIPIAFVPIFQHPPAEPEVTAPANGWDNMRARVTAMPADAPSFGNPRPLAARMDEFIQPLGWFSALFAGLAGSATGIAAYSLVAVMIQMVTLRERDIAIRIAIGAERKHIERWVLTRTVWLTGAGTVLGITGARYVAVMLHGPSHYAISDVAWLLLMVLVFGALGIFASWLPARRAAAIEPMVVWAKVG
jgi:putative ABC transport system permease protein